jgi:type IV pilus assembly protein PilM
MIADKIRRWLSADLPPVTLGLDIGTAAVKLAEVSWKTKAPVLTNFAVASLDQDTGEGPPSVPGRLGDVLQDILAKNGFKGHAVTLAIGGRNSFIREVSLPFFEKAEIAETISWDIDRYVPFEADTFYYDYAVLPEDPLRRQTKVLFVAVPKHILDPLLASVLHSGLTPHAVEIEALALYRTIPACEYELVLDIGGLCSQLVFFHQEFPSVNRTIACGGKHILEALCQAATGTTQAEALVNNTYAVSLQTISGMIPKHSLQLNALLDEFGHEIQHTLDYYRTQEPDAMPDKIVLTGGGARFPFIGEALSCRLSMPVFAHNPLQGITLPSKFAAGPLSSLAPQLTCAIGLALRGGEAYD